MGPVQWPSGYTFCFVRTDACSRMDAQWECCIWWVIRLKIQFFRADIAPGNGKGEVIIFAPSTSQHICVKTIYDPITALAPLSDCKTYAIG